MSAEGSGVGALDPFGVLALELLGVPALEPFVEPFTEPLGVPVLDPLSDILLGYRELIIWSRDRKKFEPEHDKTNKISCALKV